MIWTQRDAYTWEAYTARSHYQIKRSVTTKRYKVFVVPHPDAVIERTSLSAAKAWAEGIESASRTNVNTLSEGINHD